MLRILTIHDVLPAATRARIVRIGLDGVPLRFRSGQALSIASHGYERRRAYSIASSPADVERDGVIELLVGTDDEGVAGPHLCLERGAAVDVEGPLGGFLFPDGADERRFLFIAGGTGIAPLRAMLREVLASPGAHAAVVYSARTQADFAYFDELCALADAGRIDLLSTVTRGQAGDGWDGVRGRIDRDLVAPFVHDPRTLCFVCGPMALVVDVQAVLGSLGVPSHRICLEEWLRGHLARTSAASAAAPAGMSS